MTNQDLTVAELRARLAQAEETIRAIHFGEADAVVVEGPRGPQIYTLQSADHPYRVLVEQMHEGSVTLDQDGLILYSNPKFASILGLPGGSLAGSSFPAFVGRSDSEILAALLQAAANRGYSTGDVKLQATDGAAIPVRLSFTLLDTEELRCISVLVSDLRDQYRNEAMVKEEQLSRLILDQAGEGVVVIDPGGIVLRNSESAKLLARSSVILDHFDRAFPITVAGKRLTAADILSRVSHGDHIRGLEVYMARPDGAAAALLLSASQLCSKSDELLGCVITLTDITELKRARDELSRQARELARSNGDLRQFAYSASHDLREPLRQLAVFSELLQRKFAPTLGDEGRSLIQHAVDAAHHMEKLLQDLLAYIQAADAPQQVSGRTDANEVVRKVLGSFEEQIAQTGAVVECRQLPVLAVHEVHLVQLFQNLISNALKYRDDGAPEIRIDAEPDGNLWRLSVKDNGIGINPDYQKQIFGLFQRLHGGGKYSGSGIGLAICQKIVQRYGCKIWVESALGAGSKFFFTLPGGLA